jgi:hypothetical protein
LHAPLAHTYPLCAPFDLANTSAVIGGVANPGHVKANDPTEWVSQRRGSGDHEAAAEDEKYSFTVTKAAEPKTEFGSGKQKMNRASQLPEWVVEVLAMDSERGEVIRVTVAGDQPKVNQGQTVRFEELEAIPWANNGRDGVAYRAASIHPAAQSRAA